MRFDFAQARCIKQLLAVGLVFDQHADGVAVVAIVAVRRIRGRLALERHRGEFQVMSARDFPAGAVDRHIVPVHTAIVAENIEQRIAGRQVILDHLGTENLALDLAFAQHQKPGRVVDLRVDQHDANNAGIAQCASRLQRAKLLHLLQHVGRGIEQHPVDAITADANRRLRAGTCLDGAFTQPIAVMTVAVPLGESTASTCA